MKKIKIKIKKSDLKKVRMPSFKPGGPMKSKKDYNRKAKHRGVPDE